MFKRGTWVVPLIASILILGLLVSPQDAFAAPGDFIDIFVSAFAGGLIAPFGPVFGPDGNLYVGSFSTQQVLRYNGASGAFIDIFASGGGLVTPFANVFGPDGNLYVTSGSTDEVLRYDGTSGAFIDIFASGGGLAAPAGLVFGPDGNLYVSSVATAEVLRYNGASGAFIDSFVSAFAGGLAAPSGLVFGPDSNFYVSNGVEILRYNGASGAFIDIFASGVGVQFRGLVFGPDGNLYVSSAVTHEVLRFEGPAADLSITKGDSPDPVTAGNQLTYTLTINNGGPSDAANVVVTDTLPARVTFISASPSQSSCSEAGGVVTCNLGTIANGASATVEITVIVNFGTFGTLTNTASVSSDVNDPDATNNAVTETTSSEAGAPDVGPPPGVPGPP